MHQDALPLYIQIAAELRQNIQDAVFKIGDRLPTETELSERFGVNRHTLRQAMRILRQEGIVGVERGRGTFVTAAPIVVPLGTRVRYNEALKAQSLQPQWEVLQIASIPADAKVAQQLQIATDVPVVLFERLSLADGVPISVSSSYFPSDLFPGLRSHCEQYHSISKLLREQYDCDHIRQSTRLSARVARPQDARHLRMPATSPILLSESININQTDEVIEYGVTRFRGDRMELVIANS
ncbi:MAG: phosphonate metabolism transcriptional regulator PhnF [Spirulina sp. SIO3F2]|nr:phosphonate metabolism transcriptional regulator PhnF [Spirulina sp. SIO3F2]